MRDSCPTIEEFVDDYRLFNYAMKAYGLQDMAYAKAFMVKVLEEGVDDPNSFANKLTDKRYAEFAKAFNFAKHGADATSYSPTLKGAIELYTLAAAAEGVPAETQVAETSYYLQTIATVTSSTPATRPTASAASVAITSPIPHPGAVIVMSISMRRRPSGRGTSSIKPEIDPVNVAPVVRPTAAAESGPPIRIPSPPSLRSR